MKQMKMTKRNLLYLVFFLSPKVMFGCEVERGVNNLLYTQVTKQRVKMGYDVS